MMPYDSRLLLAPDLVRSLQLQRSQINSSNSVLLPGSLLAGHPSGICSILDALPIRLGAAQSAMPHSSLAPPSLLPLGHQIVLPMQHAISMNDSLSHSLRMLAVQGLLEEQQHHEEALMLKRRFEMLRSTTYPKYSEAEIRAASTKSKAESSVPVLVRQIEEKQTPLHKPRETNVPTHAENTEKDASLPAKKESEPTKPETSPSHTAPRRKLPKKKDGKWMESLQLLRQYKEEHGDCIVPRGYPDNPRLASWVAEQRKQYKLMKDGKQSSITLERIRHLNRLGFAWNAQDAAWSRHMEDLKRFREEHGHCHVPLNNPKYPKLGLWVKEQRRHYTLLKQGKHSHMTSSRAQELDKVGFCWDTHEATWLERFRELTKHKEQHGHCNVPTHYDVNPKLGTWVHHQRRQYKKFQDGMPCHTTAERIKALESIGFVWNPRRDRSWPACADESCSVGSETSETESYYSEEECETDSAASRPVKRQRTLSQV